MLSGASDDEAIGGAQGSPILGSRGSATLAAVIVSGHPTAFVPADVCTMARHAPRREPGENQGGCMADFDHAHVEPTGPPHRYPGGPLAVTKLSVGPFDNNAYL